MKVLHFIPNLKVAVGLEYLKYKLALLDDMAERVEVHLLTADASCLPVSSSVVVHKYSPAKLFVGMERRSFSKLLLSLKPDIVHIHTCWNLSAYNLLKLCVRSRIHTVLTLDHGMERWNMSHRYWISKLPMWIMFQRYIVINAGAVHAVSGQEADMIRNNGFYHGYLLKRVVIDRMVKVEAFNLVGGMAVRDMTDKLLMLYMKVADTTPFIQLTEDERRLEDVLLQIGVNFGRIDVPISEDLLTLLRSMDIISWRRIFLHANDEGVLEYLKTGMSAKKILIPDIDIAQIARFDKHNPKGGKQRSVKFNELYRGGFLSDVERDLCKTVVEVMWKIRQNRVHRKDFVKLYLALRFNDYDEEKVWKKMNSMHLGLETERLLCILGKRYGLGEGFMFAEPLDDKGTRKLEEKLFKSYIQ